jgi:hypothetical protein
MDLREFLRNPQQEELDDYLYDLNLVTGEYVEALTELRQLQYAEAREVDGICNAKDEAGKKLFTYKNQAESHVQANNPDRTDRIQFLELTKSRLTTDIELRKMNYYHARAKLVENRMIDGQASERGSFSL